MTRLSTLSTLSTFCTLCVISFCTLAEESVALTGDMPDYSDWYQVEIIVFAPGTPRTTDEAWAEKALAYPPDMLRIASADLSNIEPTSLSQVKDLLDYEAVLGGEASDAPITTAEEEFLFEGRSRFNRNRMIDQLADPEDSETNGNETFEAVDLTHILNPDFPQAFEAVADDERLLNRIAGSVNRSSRYRLLMHTAWRQPVKAGGEVWPVLIQTGEQFGDWHEIDGTIAISRSRYLHVEANLWYRQFARKYEQELPLPELVNEFDSETLRQWRDLVELERTRGNYITIANHELRTSRRMRSGTLHYLDHPYFGILVQIDAFEYEVESDVGLPTP